MLLIQSQIAGEAPKMMRDAKKVCCGGQIRQAVYAVISRLEQRVETREVNLNEGAHGQNTVIFISGGAELHET